MTSCAFVFKDTVNVQLLHKKDRFEPLPNVRHSVSFPHYPLLGRLNNHNDDGSANAHLWPGVNFATKFTKLTVFRDDLAKTTEFTKLMISYDGLVKTAKFTKFTIFSERKAALQILQLVHLFPFLMYITTHYPQCGAADFKFLTEIAKITNFSFFCRDFVTIVLPLLWK